MTINSRQELFRILKELKEENQSELQMQKKAARRLKPYKAENSDTEIEEDEEEPADDKKPKEEKPEEKPKEKNADASKKAIEKIKKTPTTIPSKIDVSSIVDKIDLIRAGGSLKDEAIIKNLESYVFSLDEVQKKSLYVYLDSLSRIIFAKQDSAEVSVPKASNTNPKPEKQEKPSKVSNAGLPVVSVAKKI